MAGVLKMAWRSGRSYQEGNAELKVMVYWRHGGMRGGTGVRMVGVQGIRGGTGETVLWGQRGVAWRYWGVPLTPLTTQGERRGIPWPR